MTNALVCAGCGSPMAEQKDPDMTFHQCAACGGVFLDKGELNELETGMGGDIEYNTLAAGPGKEKNDSAPTRRCPRCVDQPMDKKALLVYSNIIFDYCPNCGGFYLDKGEVEEMNAYLQSINKNKRPEKYRGFIDNHWVHLDILEGEDLRAAFAGFTAFPESICVLKTSVYFKKPLQLGLRIHSEKWTERFMNLIGLAPQRSIATGDKKFDSIYWVQGSSEASVQALLSKNELQRALMDIHQNRPKMLTRSGTLEVLDDRLIYSEGPYAGDVTYDVEQDPAGVVKRLVQLATFFE